jgi:stalled ribosome rescue protein Dom34
VPRDVEFFKRIITDLTGLHAILVVGPSGAKAEFVNYIREKHPPLNKAIVGLETVDHPSERQLLKLAHSYFKIADRIMP